MENRNARSPVLPALVADIACVVFFVALGRRNHAGGVSVGGVAETAWPFLTGTAIGWLLSRGWHRPTALAPTGVVVWVCTVVVGMLLRQATSEGTAASFVVVATVATALLILGWRVLVGWRAVFRRWKVRVR
jgi:peptidoglycan/LPS O-acetylase OafA/YrhL